MDTTNKSPSRRNFLKGVVINGAVLSAIPLGVLKSESTTPAPAKKAKAPRLPLKIYLNTRAGYFYRDPVGAEYLFSVDPRSPSRAQRSQSLEHLFAQAKRIPGKGVRLAH